MPKARHPPPTRKAGRRRPKRRPPRRRRPKKGRRKSAKSAAAAARKRAAKLLDGIDDPPVPVKKARRKVKRKKKQVLSPVPEYVKTADQPSRTGELPLEANAQILDDYYKGLRLRSPMGGHLDMIGSRGFDDGQAAVIFECTVSSLRFELVIPNAKAAEMKDVEVQVDSVEDPVCPRCGPLRPLILTGPKWVCRCGVPFSKG